MAKQQKGWVYSPSKTKSNLAVPAAFKDEIKRRGDELIESTIAPTHLEPPPDDPQFNYIEQIGCYWRGRYFYFVATYRVAGPNAISPTFESKFARMEYQGNSTFNLAFQRFNDQWVEIGRAVSADDCFGSIGSDPLFHP
jgi:hypothetical protein